MGKPKLARPKYPEIDWLMAGFLERKRVMNLTWDEIGAAAGMNGNAFRRLAATKSPADWPKDIRQNVCRMLGLEVKTFVVGSPEDPTK